MYGILATLDANFWSSAVLVAGGVALAALTLASARSWSRDAVQLPALRGELGELRALVEGLRGRCEAVELRAKEAGDVAEKARRVASERSRKAERKEGGPLPVDESPASVSPAGVDPSSRSASISDPFKWAEEQLRRSSGNRLEGNGRPRPVSVELES